MNKAFFEEKADYFYVVFRVIIGILFLMHGLMKWSTIMSGDVGLMFFAGIIEIIGGIFLILGFLVRYTAIITALEMIVAFVKAHLPQGINPLANQGEAAVLFFAAFLVLIAFGARRWALDNVLRR